MKKNTITILACFALSVVQGQMKTVLPAYVILKSLEFPINKYYNDEYYIKIEKQLSDESLQKIAKEVRLKRAIDSHVGATYHFVQDNKVVCILKDNFKDIKGYRCFRNDTASFSLEKMLDSIRLKTYRSLPDSILGYWSSASNAFVGLMIIYKTGAGWTEQNYFANGVEGYSRKLEVKELDGKKYFCFKTDGDPGYYFINEYGDIEFYADSSGFKMAFYNTYYRLK
ncbi:MAG TPA: hypothetical protein VKQ52_02520 [Puia sp.]|nr:hypothetical protein [Puia sp.]